MICPIDLVVPFLSLLSCARAATINARQDSYTFVCPRVGLNGGTLPASAPGAATITCTQVRLGLIQPVHVRFQTLHIPIHAVSINLHRIPEHRSIRRRWQGPDLIRYPKSGGLKSIPSPGVDGLLFNIQVPALAPPMIHSKAMRHLPVCTLQAAPSEGVFPPESTNPVFTASPWQRTDLAGMVLLGAGSVCNENEHFQRRTNEGAGCDFIYL